MKEVVWHNLSYLTYIQRIFFIETAMTTVTLPTDTRLEALKNWLATCLPQANFTIHPLAGDASFRRYFRIQHQQQSWIAMDAPPELEDSHSFVAIQQHLEKLSLHAPHLYHVNLAQGFILMSDLGDIWLWHQALSPQSPHLYQAAINDLITLQHYALPAAPLPRFDAEFIRKELNFFTQWFLQDYLKLTLSAAETVLLEKTFQQLITNAEEQPYYFTHRDYHSRNLMVLDNNKIGILDFQDAVVGPITYDLVSLLRDCYVTLNNDQLQTHLQDYYHKAVHTSLLQEVTFFTI